MPPKTTQAPSHTIPPPYQSIQRMSYSTPIEVPPTSKTRRRAKPCTMDGNALSWIIRISRDIQE